MNQEGSILNFMALVDESEKIASNPPPAPFNLTQQTQKVIFQKVRAKNFRSVGNDWMEVDFLKAKSTLVVSEDNGSGKSTLTVWAPYFALFDKPYNPKELKAALVNSATNKDAVVELFFNTKGKNWLIRRGYKPALFEILFQDENGNWIKDRAPAAMRDQQKYLESIIGFDAKIAENVMILGSDKFTPFVEMDSPSRRHVVERIWDLAVFPVMLKVAKEDSAVLTRHSEESFRNIDSIKEKIKHSLEIMEQIKSKTSILQTLDDRTKELETKGADLDRALVDLKSEQEYENNKLSAENERMENELKTIKSEIEDLFAERIKGGENAVLIAKEEGKKEIDFALHNLQIEIENLNHSLQQLEQDEANELRSLKEKGAQEYTALQDALKHAEVEFKSIAVDIRSSRQFVFEKQTELDNQKILLDLATKTKEEIGEKLDVSNCEFKDSSVDIEGIEKRLFVLKEELKQKTLAKKDIETEISKFEHMGTCPTCSQHVGQEAIDSFKKNFEEKLKQFDTTQIVTQISKFNEELAEKEDENLAISSVLKDLKAQQESVEAEIDLHNKNIRKLEDEYVVSISTWNSVTESIINSSKLDFMQSINDKIKDLVNDTKLRQAELTTKWEEMKRVVRSKIENHQARISQVRAEVSSAVNDKIRKVELALSEIKSAFDAQLYIKTSKKQASLEAFQIFWAEKTRAYGRRFGELFEESKKVKKEIEVSKAQALDLRKTINVESVDRQEKIDELERTLILEEKQYQNFSDRTAVYKRLINELGDKAAKAEIIKAYMPYLNYKVNEYLDALNLHVGFKMDENFSIEFSAPDRKRQTTWSLSKGQAMRMNLAVLFALRDVANLKASVSTNLLIMDETIEPLSERGVQEIMEMFSHRFKDVNMFVVTQRKAEFSEYFTDVINYGLRGGFTVQL